MEYHLAFEPLQYLFVIAAAVLVGLDGFVEMSSADPGTARVTGVVLGDAGGPRVRFDITYKREEGFSC